MTALSLLLLLQPLFIDTTSSNLPPIRRRLQQTGCDYIIDENPSPSSIPSCEWTSLSRSISYECVNTTTVKKTTYTGTGCQLGNIQSEEFNPSGLFGSQFDCSNGRTCKATGNIFTGSQIDCDSDLSTVTPSSQITRAGGVCFSLPLFNPGSFKYSCDGDALVLDHFLSGGDCSGIFTRKFQEPCSASGTTVAKIDCSDTNMPSATAFPEPYFKREPCDDSSNDDTVLVSLDECYSLSSAFGEKHACIEDDDDDFHEERLYAGGDCGSGSLFAVNTIREDACFNGVKDECETGNSYNSPTSLMGGDGIKGKTFADLQSCLGNNNEDSSADSEDDDGEDDDDRRRLGKKSSSSSGGNGNEKNYIASILYKENVKFSPFSASNYTVVCHGSIVKELENDVTIASYSLNECAPIGQNGSQIIGRAASGELLGGYIRIDSC